MNGLRPLCLRSCIQGGVLTWPSWCRDASGGCIISSLAGCEKVSSFPTILFTKNMPAQKSFLVSHRHKTRKHFLEISWHSILISAGILSCKFPFNDIFFTMVKNSSIKRWKFCYIKTENKISYFIFQFILIVRKFQQMICGSY